MVRKGYKQTEVGVIPEDWELKTIGDIGSVSSGGTPSRTNPLYWDGSIAWITTTQIDFNIIDEAEQFITQNGLNNSAAKLFPPGTLLMAMYGQGKTRGKVAILDIEASTNQACAAISLNNNIEHNYIFHFLVNQYDCIRNLSNTGNQENLNGLIIKSIKIPLPPKKEQHAIAKILSDVDALIAALDKLIAKKRNIKTATMQQLLTGKKRLPGFGEGKGYKKTEVGVIPEDWEVLPLGELTSFVGSGKSIVKRGSGNYPLYGSTGVIGYSQKFEYEGDSILVARVGANAGKLNFVSGLYGVSDNTIMIKLKNDSDLHFFLYQLWNKDLNSLVFGSGQPLITGTQIKNLSVVCPRTTEQQAIAQVLFDIDTEITALEKRRAKTLAIKQGMMQELLTGRVRLKFEA